MTVIERLRKEYESAQGDVITEARRLTRATEWWMGPYSRSACRERLKIDIELLDKAEAEFDRAIEVRDMILEECAQKGGKKK